MKVCLECACAFEAANWKCPECGFLPESADDHLSFAPKLAADYEGYAEGAFSQLAQFEDRNFWFRSRNRLLFWAFRRFFPHALSFLEIGCGTGFVLRGFQREFPKVQLAGSDIFDTGLSFARRRLPNIRLFQLDARSIPFSAEFDAIGAFDVIEHIREDEQVLAQLFQALKPGGGILLTVPQHAFLWSGVDELAHHQRRYSRRELVEKVQRAGFTVRYVSSFVSLLLPLMFLSRWLRREKSPDLYAEFRIGSGFNWLLEQALTVERNLLKSGITFPMGGSLLLAAQRDRS